MGHIWPLHVFLFTATCRSRREVSPSGWLWERRRLFRRLDSFSSTIKSAWILSVRSVKAIYLLQSSMSACAVHLTGSSFSILWSRPRHRGAQAWFWWKTFRPEWRRQTWRSSSLLTAPWAASCCLPPASLPSWSSWSPPRPNEPLRGWPTARCVELLTSDSVVKQQIERLVTLHPPQFQHVPLYLEWAPVGVFVAGKPEPGKNSSTSQSALGLKLKWEKRFKSPSV